MRYGAGVKGKARAGGGMCYKGHPDGPQPTCREPIRLAPHPKKDLGKVTSKDRKIKIWTELGRKSVWTDVESSPGNLPWYALGVHHFYGCRSIRVCGSMHSPVFGTTKSFGAFK